MKQRADPLQSVERDRVETSCPAPVFRHVFIALAFNRRPPDYARHAVDPGLVRKLRRAATNYGRQPSPILRCQLRVALPHVLDGLVADRVPEVADIVPKHLGQRCRGADLSELGMLDEVETCAASRLLNALARRDPATVPAAWLERVEVGVGARSGPLLPRVRERSPRLLAHLARPEQPPLRGRRPVR